MAPDFCCWTGSSPHRNWARPPTTPRPPSCGSTAQRGRPTRNRRGKAWEPRRMQTVTGDYIYIIYIYIRYHQVLYIHMYVYCIHVYMSTRFYIYIYILYIYIYMCGIWIVWNIGKCMWWAYRLWHGKRDHKYSIGKSTGIYIDGIHFLWIDINCFHSGN